MEENLEFIYTFFGYEYKTLAGSVYSERYLAFQCKDSELPACV